MFPIIPHTGFAMPYNFVLPPSVGGVLSPSVGGVLSPAVRGVLPPAMSVGYLGQKELSKYVTSAQYPSLQGFLIEYKSIFFRFFTSDIRSPEELFHCWAGRFTKMCQDNGIQPSEMPKQDAITMKIISDIYTFIVYLWNSGQAPAALNQQNNAMVPYM